MLVQKGSMPVSFQHTSPARMSLYYISPFFHGIFDMVVENLKLNLWLRGTITVIELSVLNTASLLYIGL